MLYVLRQSYLNTEHKPIASVRIAQSQTEGTSTESDICESKVLIVVYCVKFKSGNFQDNRRHLAKILYCKKF